MKRTCLMITLALAAPCVAADNTSLDPSFGTAGRSNLTAGAYYKGVVAHLPRPGGGSVVVTSFSDVNAGNNPLGPYTLGLYPFQASGTPSAGQSVPTNVNFAAIGGAAIDSQGRVVVIGSTGGPDGSIDFRVARLLPTGLPDNSFGGDGIVDIAFNLGGSNHDIANAVAIDAQDRIVVVGSVQRASADDIDFGSARLLGNGALDTSFNGSGKRVTFFDLATTSRSDLASTVVIGSNGLINIGGRAFDGGLNVWRIGLVRLTDAGAPDVTFCPGSCNFMGTYNAINNGRRVIFYGNDVPAVSDSISAMSINAVGELVTAGTTPGVGETLGYVQKFDTAGNWLAEVATQGGLGGQVWIGGVHWTQPGTPDSNVVLTGVSGPNEEFFFAQRFDSALFPTANWGALGPSNSVYPWTASGDFGDMGDNRPGRSSIDSAGRVLVGGQFKSGSLSNPYSSTASRLTYNGSVAIEVFKNSFE